ncbi:hypothetical protein ANN_00192 [Periplaneta americana]|uniref:Uncharacterized protein n=1 Tax=Periplaneta americana TaxID=6978 RepID=A0ABQ8TSH0_PERAM|nr:hypothetical protein ANN_00192 [Periplaneta americana]
MCAQPAQNTADLALPSTGREVHICLKKIRGRQVTKKVNMEKLKNKEDRRKFKANFQEKAATLESTPENKLHEARNRPDDLAIEDEEATSKDEKEFPILNEEIELALKEMKNGKQQELMESPLN